MGTEIHITNNYTLYTLPYKQSKFKQKKNEITETICLQGVLTDPLTLGSAGIPVSVFPSLKDLLRVARGSQGVRAAGRGGGMKKELPV